MFNSYVNRFNKMFDSINSDITKTYAHLDKQNSFTRKRKMPLADIILCTISKKRINHINRTSPIFYSKMSIPHEYFKTRISSAT